MKWENTIKILKDLIEKDLEIIKELENKILKLKQKEEILQNNFVELFVGF